MIYKRNLVMRFIYPLLLSPFLLFSTAAYAGVYKWIDSAGNIHYGDKPPETADKLQKLEIEDPSAGTSSDTNGLRSGELRMLKNIERKRERAAKARRQRTRQETKDNQRKALEEATMSKKCDALEARIDKIQGRLRQGHSAAQGAKLHQTRREIAAKIRRYCK